MKIILVYLCTLLFSVGADQNFDLEMAGLTDNDRALTKAIFDRVTTGRLLTPHSPPILRRPTSGPSIKTNQGILFLDDISFTSKIICNFGLSGLEECYRCLDGPNQNTRIVAIFALHQTFDDGHNTVLEITAPMLGVSDEAPRDLNDEEINALKLRYLPKIEELRKQYNKKAEQAASSNP